MSLILAAKGSTKTAFGVHGLTAALMILAANPLLMGDELEMLHTHLVWLWYAVAALMLVDAVGYTFGADRPNPTRAESHKAIMAEGGFS